MPITPTFPGVYIEEVPSAVRTIVGVPTAIAAFVGPARRGPVDRAVHITSWGDFERIFGGLWRSSLMSYAVSQFYANGGGEAEVVRVVATTLPATIDLGGGVKLETVPKGAKANTATATVEHDPADAQRYTLKLKHDTTQESHAISVAAGSPDRLDTKLAGSAIARPTTDSMLDVRPAAAADVPGKGGRDGAERATLTIGTAAKKTTLRARYPGATGNSLRARVDHQTADPSDTKLYNLTVRDTTTGAEETYRNIRVGNRAASQSLQQQLLTSRLVEPTLEVADERPPANKAAAPGRDPIAEDPGNDDDPTKRPYTVGRGGADGEPPTEAELAGSEAAKTGLHALLDADIVNILCIPPIDRDTALTATVLTPAVTLCVREWAMLLVDAPKDWNDVDIAVAGMAAPPVTGTAARNAVLTFPWIRQLDGAGQLAELPPSGAVAGIWARTDAERGVWKAPAGIDAAVNGISGLTVTLTDLENGRLNPLGANCLRTFPQIGTVVWGARTLRGADAFADQWKYVPVRRLALFIEETLFRALRWVVFEPNDEPLWASIRLNVGAFMNSLFRRGAFQGASPREAYLVQCDQTNNPQNQIDQGIVTVDVGFAPLKPTEFVFIRIQQLAGQIQT